MDGETGKYFSFEKGEYVGYELEDLEEVSWLSVRLSVCLSACLPLRVMVTCPSSQILVNKVLLYL